MSAPLVVSIPHRLGQQEATRRLKAGLQRARTDFSHLITVEEETWSGEQVILRLRALGQSCNGTLAVLENELRLEVQLPWLLAALAGKFVPTLRREATLLLEKK
jgi:hypothetical protein